MVHWAFVPMGDAGMYLVSRVKQSTRPSEAITAEQARRFKSENETLHRQVRFLAAKLTAVNDRIQAGQTVISKLFGRDRDLPVKLIPARIVAGDSLPYGWTRLVNAGEKKSVRPNMAVTTRCLLTDRAEKMPKNLAVLSGESLVGRLIESAAFTARLQLLTDRGFVISAHIKRIIDYNKPRTVQQYDRLRKLTPQTNRPIDVLVIGDGAGGLIASEVKKVHNIRLGDRLQTRPNSFELSVALEMGTVIKILDDPKHPGMVTLHIKPTAEMPSLREVFIVVPRAGSGKKGGK